MAEYGKNQWKFVFRIHTPDNKNITKVIAHMTTHHLIFIISSKNCSSNRPYYDPSTVDDQITIKNHFVSCPCVFNPISKQLNIGSSIENEFFKSSQEAFFNLMPLNYWKQIDFGLKCRGMPEINIIRSQMKDISNWGSTNACHFI